MKFYATTQINSGGYYIKDLKLGVNETIIIQAKNEDEAFNVYQNIKEQYGEDAFDDYCNCCGSRWDDEFEEISPNKLMDFLSDSYCKSSSIILNNGEILNINKSKTNEKQLQHS
tara:strand:+ start:716 stop:1057 length:342 start_codon:yes stop_codon:yes gene_type:complete